MTWFVWLDMRRLWVFGTVFKLKLCTPLPTALSASGNPGLFQRGVGIDTGNPRDFWQPAHIPAEMRTHSHRCGFLQVWVWVFMKPKGLMIRSRIDDTLHMFTTVTTVTCVNFKSTTASIVSYSTLSCML